jgi:hypothetical protein
MAKDQLKQKQSYFRGKYEESDFISLDHFMSLWDLLKKEGFDDKILAWALDCTDEYKCGIGAQDILPWLRAELKKLRSEERKPGSAPARRRRALARKHIADLATILLDRLWTVPPDTTAKSNRDHLICLFEELLNVDRHRAAFADQAQYTAEFERALSADAAAAFEGKTIGVNKLAREAGVSPATIIAWRKSFNYKLRLQQKGAGKNLGRVQLVHQPSDGQDDAGPLPSPRPARNDAQ